jgi:gamma-glutamyl:cysteine ligase YbdK (ATP-grasp superfamily)
MGRDIDRIEFSREDRVRYREKVKANLAALEQLVREGRFETGRRLCGVECEVYITDRNGDPAPINAKLLEKIASDEFQTELAQFNIEFGVQPRRLADHVFHAMEVELRRSLNHAHAMAEQLDARVVIIGILPTLNDFDITEQNLSGNPRYKALNDIILNQRGENIQIRI